MRHSIPSYDLFGEILTGDLPDALHYEELAERSSKHDWTIRLHRHTRLAQVFLFSSPQVTYRLGDQTFNTSEPLVLVVPPGEPHAFSYPVGTTGDVLSLQTDRLDQEIQELISEVATMHPIGLSFSASRHFDDIAELMARIRAHFLDISSTKRSEILKSLCRLLLLYLAADHQSTVLTRPRMFDQLSGSEVYADRFCKAVEEQFTLKLSVADYAEIVGISASHLTRVCRTFLGSPPNQLIRQRRLFEAKRLLRYTGMPASQIGRFVGFEEAPYFARVFKKEMGLSPLEYRAQADQAA
ncbi:MAG: helix-turn-helix domain-containing protein [Pseudomonadota bacterium]